MAVRTSRSGALAFAEEIVRQMFTFLLVIHALIAAALVTVILMQRSEGGGLGMGGGPAGLMTARGAADFLTRATSVLATLFVVMAFVLATVASMRNSAGKIDTSLQNQGTPGPITAPLPAALPATGRTEQKRRQLGPYRDEVWRHVGRQYRAHPAGGAARQA